MVEDMVRAFLALIIAAASVTAARAAEPSPTCKALKGLAEAARTSGPQRISFGAANDPSIPQALSLCSHATGAAAAKAFCDAAGRALGFDPSSLPRLVYGCVRTMAADPHLTTEKVEVGGEAYHRDTHLTAKLGGGVRLDLVLADPQGPRYSLVVWKAD